MIRGSANRSRWGWSAWAVVALAVALRLTVLPGYMIAAEPSTMAVVMCTADGAITQTIESAAGKAAPGKGDSEHPGKNSVCPFATAGVALAALDSPVDISIPPAHLPVRLPFGAGLIGQGLAAPPPPSTGPPLSL